MAKKKNNNRMKFGITEKMILCLMIPVIFMIIIGVASYRKSVSAMTENAKASSIETVNMLKAYVAANNDFISAEASKYAFNADLNSLFIGTYDSDINKQAAIKNQITSEITAANKTNDYISNIFIIPGEENTILTTQSSGKVGDRLNEGFRDEYIESVEHDGKKLTKWIDSHELLDRRMTLNSDKSIMSYQLYSTNKMYVVVFDISSKSLKKTMDDIDLGKGSIIGIVTKNGRELISVKNDKDEIAEPDKITYFADKDFYLKCLENDQVKGCEEVRFNGERYFYVYSKEEESGACVCALVPKKTVTANAYPISVLTFIMVITATVLALGIGFWIIRGIHVNMEGISGKIKEVASGNLSVSVSAVGNDEFKGLADSTSEMVSNTRKLVDKVSTASGVLENTSGEVKNTSDTINRYSQEVSHAVLEIRDSMNEQTKYAGECVERTNLLADEMNEVNRVITEVSALVENTGRLINDAKDTVRKLGETAHNTRDISAQVSESAEILQKETDTIFSFVETITDISEETNLLSLNASIEAARAGESGRGFAVVAEAIRKLAENSAVAAGQIRGSIENITSQTDNTVNSAKKAREMVMDQNEMVDKMITIFNNMERQMQELENGLADIVKNANKANTEKDETIAYIQNISALIEENGACAQNVDAVMSYLMEDVKHLDDVARTLNRNMEELKTEILHFKI